jgi:hypothetical protein
MIAKRILRGRTKDTFKRLGLYILGEKVVAQSAAGASWGATAAYVLDLPGGGARVAQIRISNCVAAEPSDAIAEIAATQALNVRAKGDKTYHLVVSFPPGEQPSEAQLHDIEDELCAAIGLADHQRISAVHTDTGHLHIHIAINKVHAATRRCIEPWYDKRKLMAACDRLEIKHGLARTAHGEKRKGTKRGGEAEMEAFSGQEALITWMKANVLGDIQSCLKRDGGWQELHQTLAVYGLAIKPRGAGLMIAASDGKIAVRASRFFRALSAQALSTRWGPYQAPIAPMPPAKMRYERAPKRKHAASTRLWVAYCEQRRLAEEGRAAALATFREEDTNWSLAIKKWWRETEFRISHAWHRTAEGRRPMWHEARASLARKADEIQEWRNQRRREIARGFPLPNWFEFLQFEAARGDGEALAILRLKEDQERQAGAAFATASDPAQARHVVFSALRPIARKNGQLVYTLKDGGRIVDDGHGVRLETVTPHAMFLTLSIHAERWPGRRVPLEEDDAFKRQMVEIAARTKLDLTFADPVLERLRCRLRGLPEPPSTMQQTATHHVGMTGGNLLTRLGRAVMGNSGKARA